MPARQANPPVLAYAGRHTPVQRRRSELATWTFLAALAGFPFAAISVAALANFLGARHKAICPSCGGWGATMAVAATAVFVLGCVVVLIRTIRLPGRAASIILSSVAVVLAILELLLVIVFYLAIQAM